MKKIIIIISFFSIAFSQISMNDINGMNNAQLDLIKDQLKTPQSVSDLDTDIDIQTAKPSVVNISDLENEVIEKTSLDSGEVTFYSEFFGYDYFNRKTNFFDNIPVPANYTIGPGDEVIISIWGEHNLRKNFVINKAGLIYYDSIGYINISGKTILEAQTLLITKLSSIYSTLNDGSESTNLMIELGTLKSINVYFSGNIKEPGIHLIHPFSDIFLAIVQAGGVDKNGSLRDIHLIRDNKKIESIDFYSFFKTGKSSFKNLKLIDGDTIHIPSAISTVKVNGPFETKKLYFEMKKGETINDLLVYTDGLKHIASSYFIVDTTLPIADRITDDNARTTFIVNYKDINLNPLKDGDIISVKDIGEVQSSVEILGRVKIRGYFAVKDASLKSILDLAGGFNDPIYRKSIDDNKIVILRQTEDQYYGIELVSSYENSENFLLEANDKVFVYENSKYNESSLVRIEGEVYKRGSFPLKDNMTLGDLIEAGGGYTPKASQGNVQVFIETTTLDNSGKSTTEKEFIFNTSPDFLLTKNTVVNVLPDVNLVRVIGNVFSPGLIAYSDGMTMSNAIELAGGYKKYSMKKKVYVERASGKIVKAKIFRGKGKRVFPGDTVFVPVNPNPSDFEITSFISDMSTTLANIAAILLIVDNQKD